MGIRSIIILTASVVVLLLCLGCSGGNLAIQPESDLDRHWGESFETAKQNQIANPDAGYNLEPVEGFDGQAAENSEMRYRKSFTGEIPKNVYNLNLGIGGK